MEKVVEAVEASVLNCPRPSTGKILSTSELEEMKKNLSLLSDSVDNYIRKTQQVISTFNDQNIVQSFYSSGKFGTEQRQKLEKIGTALQKYWNVINGGEDSMIGQTNKYIEMSLENVSGGTTGGSTSGTSDKTKFKLNKDGSYTILPDEIFQQVLYNSNGEQQTINDVLVEEPEVDAIVNDGGVK